MAFCDIEMLGQTSGQRSTIDGGRSVARLLCGAALLAFAPTAAVAQTANEEVPSVNEIIVTAQRRAEALEDVPMSIAAVSGETLSKADVANVHEIGRVAAGVQINYAGAFTGAAIRGVTSITNGNNIENNVAMYVDGFYEPNTLAINLDLPNVAGIEVLKGPQGTLYGRNATGGAILISTLAPSDTTTAKVELTYGRFEDKRFSAYVSGPISEHIRFGVAGYYRDYDGYLRLIDPVNPNGKSRGAAARLKQSAVRAKLEADLGATLSVTLAYNFAYADDAKSNTFSPRQNINLASYVAGINGGANPNGPTPPLFPDDPYEISYTYRTSVPVKAHQGTLTLKWDTGIGKLSSYTGYKFTTSRTEFDFDGTAADLVFSKNRWDQDTWQQGVDLVIDRIEGLDLVVGGLYYHDFIRTIPEYTVSYTRNLTPQLGTQYGLKTDAWAVYVDATYHLTDALSITAGGRYSYEKKNGLFEARCFIGGCNPVPLTRREATYKKFTPRVSVRYELAPRTNIYATWTKGFRPGTISGSGPIAASPELWQFIEEEEITAYEVGFKTANSVFRLDLAAFYYDYKNLHVNVQQRSPLCAPEPAPCGTLLTLFANAPKAEIYGLDGQVSIAPTENLNLRAGAAWLHARYMDFTNATGTGVNATGLNVTQTQDWSNKQMARAPTFSGNVGFDYKIPDGNGGFLIAANANYTDGFVVSNPSLFGPLAGAALSGKQRFRTNSYALVSASLTWTEPSGHMYVGIYGKNLTNKLYRVTFNGGPFGSYSTFGEPRTYGVKLGFRY